MLDKGIKLFHGFCENVIGLCMLVSVTKTSWVTIVLAEVLFVVFFFLQKLLEKVEEKYLFGAMTLLYLAVGIYWVTHVHPIVRMDAENIHSAAVSLLAGDDSFLVGGGYFDTFNFQLGMVTYEALLGLISTDVRFIYFVNLLEVIGINFASWRLADICFGQNHKTNRLVILVTFLFLPQFFFMAFAYGIIPGLFFLMWAFYFQQRWFRNRKRRNLVLCILFITLAVMLKGNNLVGAIVIAILFFLQMLKEKKMRNLLFAGVVMLCAGMIGDVVSSCYEWKADVELSGGAPSLLWIVMGTQPYNTSNAPGWFNGYNMWAYNEADYDPQKATEIAKNTLKDTIFTYKEHPDCMISFFSGMMKVLWCDPLYESLWSGPIPLSQIEEAQNKTQFLRDIYSGTGAEPYVAGFMKAFVILMFAMAVLSACSRQNQKWACDYLYLYFVGGFLLHILWETKSQYVYSYVSVMLPCAAQEMSVLFDKLEALRSRKRQVRVAEENGKGEAD